MPSHTATPSPVTSAHLIEGTTLYGPLPLIKGENKKDYEELVTKIFTSVKPRDDFEKLYVRDAADLTWDIFRWRRLKAELFNARAYMSVQKLLESSSLWVDAKVTAEEWDVSDTRAVAKVNAHLKARGLTSDAIMAEALVQNLESIERIDKLIRSAEERRNAVFREIRIYRAALARVVQAALKAIEDVEFAEVEACDLRDADGLAEADVGDEVADGDEAADEDEAVADGHEAADVDAGPVGAVAGLGMDKLT